jgi:DNA-directed RNA polymerase subunit RPC12/RpoP
VVLRVGYEVTHLMSDTTHGMAAAYREAEQSNSERAGECPRCGREMEPRHHRWVGGAYDEEYPEVRCDGCGNTYEPEFGWHRGTTRHHAVTVHPDGDDYRAMLQATDAYGREYPRDNITTVEVFGGEFDPDERNVYTRVGVTFPDAETLRLYV